MDALPSSCSDKIFAGNYRNRPSDSSSRASTLLRPAISFLRSSKFDCCFFVTRKSIGSQLKAVRSISPSSLSEEHEADARNTDSQIQDKCETKTVHVKFKLHKACLFGQQFLLVGEDPIFGFWEPLNAIPLDWSEDHVWTTELDVPVGKTFQFKFILKGDSEEIKWQPGPDRVLQTWETKNTIVIVEDWGNAELQEITEESVTEVTEPREELTADLEVEPIIAENKAGTNGTNVTTKKPISTNIKDQLISYEGDPVLVPGLTPVAPMKSATEEAVPSEVANDNVNANSSVLVPGSASDSQTMSTTEEAVPAEVTNDNVSTYSSVLVPGLASDSRTMSATEQAVPAEVTNDNVSTYSSVLVPGLASDSRTMSATEEAVPAEVTNDNVSTYSSVLVPGLAPKASINSATEEVIPGEVGNDIIVDASVADEPNDHKIPKLAETKEPDPLLGALPDVKPMMPHPEENLHDGFEETDSNIGYRETASNDRLKENSGATEEPENLQPRDVLTNDTQWVRKILQRFFLNLFPQEST